MPRQAEKVIYLPPNVPQGGLKRPSNIMLGIMRSRLSVTSANRAPRTTRRLRIIYIILNGRNRTMRFNAAASRKTIYLPRTPKGAS